MLGSDADAWRMGAAASALAGQPNFAGRGDNAWGPADRASFSWPYGLSARGGRLATADTGNNRVLIWGVS